MIEDRSARRTGSGSGDGDRMAARGSSPRRAGGLRGRVLPSAVLAAVLTSCTGVATPQSSPMVSGIASDSAGLSGVVTLKDASPAGNEVSARTDPTGSFAVDVSGLTPPEDSA